MTNGDIPGGTHAEWKGKYGLLKERFASRSL